MLDCDLKVLRAGYSAVRKAMKIGTRCCLSDSPGKEEAEEERRKQGQVRNLKAHPLVTHFLQVGPTFQRFYTFLKETNYLNVEE